MNKKILRHKQGVAFYPYDQAANQNCYIKNMKDILLEFCSLYPFSHGIETLHSMLHSRFIFLNWFENELTIEDRFILLLARMLHKKIIWTFHNALPHEGESRQDRKSLYFMCRISTDIILLSHASRWELSLLVREKKGILKKAFYIPHVNYCDNYMLSKSNASYSIREPFTFLYFGNIRPYKNLELLIHTFHKLFDKNAVLLIAGNPMDAQYAKKIKSLCKDNEQIRLDFQYIPDSKVFDYMQKADVLVLPYNKRSSMNSGAMIAAFSCRKPVIVPDIAMARDYSDKEYVYQYHYRSAREHGKKLGEAMQRAYQTGRERNNTLGLTAYQDVRRYNSKDIVRERLLRGVMKKDGTYCKKENSDRFTCSHSSSGCRQQAPGI